MMPKTCRWCKESFDTVRSLKYHQTKGKTSTECIRKQEELESEIHRHEIMMYNKCREAESEEKCIDEKTTIPDTSIDSFLQKAFNYGEKLIRVIIEDDEHWFCAKDVCAVLDLTNSSEAISSFDTDEKRLLKIHDPLGVKRETACVNESGLYRLIFKSRKENAKLFQRWIVKEVIPQIRKTGTYQAPNIGSPLLIESSFNADQSKIIQGMISLLRHLPVPCSPGTSLLYLGYLGLDEDFHHFKFGITENWADRVKDLTRDFDGEFSPIFVRPGIGRAVEQELKRFFTSKGLLTKYKTKPYTEIFFINEDMNIDNVMDEIERLSCLSKSVAKVEDLEHQLREEKHKGELSEFKIRESEFKVRDSESRTRESELRSKILELEFKAKIVELEHKMEKFSKTSSR